MDTFDLDSSSKDYNSQPLHSGGLFLGSEIFFRLFTRIGKHFE